MGPKSPAEATILVVDDNPVDTLMIKMALKKGGFLQEPMTLDDGVPAMEFLSRRGQFSAAILPDLVILDLNLKCVDGPEVLEFIRSDANLKGIFVSILSSSPADVMVRRAAAANNHFSKPSDLTSFMKLGDEIMNGFASSLAG